VSKLLDAIATGRKRLDAIREEVGYRPHDGEPIPWEVTERYIEQLEAAVIAAAAYPVWRRTP
jgi:hypothetical protein